MLIRREFYSGSISSLVRLKYIHDIGHPSIQFFNSATQLILWSILEVALGLIAACLATLRPLFRPCLRRRDKRSNDPNAPKRSWLGPNKSVSLIPRKKKHTIGGDTLATGATESTMWTTATDSDFGVNGDAELMNMRKQPDTIREDEKRMSNGDNASQRIEFDVEAQSGVTEPLQPLKAPISMDPLLSSPPWAARLPA